MCVSGVHLFVWLFYLNKHSYCSSLS